MSSPPVQIILAAETLTPRLIYACDIVFHELLGIRHLLLTPGDERLKETETPVLFYTSAHPGAGKAWLQSSGWLSETKAPAHDERAPETAGRKGFFFPAADARSLLPYDALASVCWLAALADHFLEGQTDEHGRCTICYDEPVAHLAAAELLGALQKAFPQAGLKAGSRTPDWFLTIDVDQPWKHAHKGWDVVWGGLLRDALLFRREAVAERLAARRGRDPYEVYDLITSACPADKTILFFLMDGNHSNDSRFFSDNPAYAALIRKLALEQSYASGIHPSYDSYADNLLIREQCAALQKITGKPVTASRQHYLRYRLPLTFHYLADAGIRHEYSLCPLQGPGFVNGFCISYPWFDLWYNELSQLTLHPSVVMDRGLLNAGMSTAQGQAALDAIRKKVHEVQGEFRIILHNETFSDNGEWKGWTKTWLQLIDSLKEAGV